MVRTIDAKRRPIPGNDERNRRPRVAVIGLGMAGCVAAHFLSKEYDVTCFEQMSVPGLYAHSLCDLPGNIARLDMPLRAVSPHYYRNLFQLYRHLSIELEQTNYQHTVVDLDTAQTLFSYINVCFLGIAFPLPYLALSRVCSALMILLGLLQFVLLTPWLLVWNRGAVAEQSLAAHMAAYGYNSDFQHLFFYPMLSTLLSCSYRQVQEYPAVLVAEFMCANATTLFTGWFRVRGQGVTGVAHLLLRGLEGRCHFDIRVESVATKCIDGVTTVEVTTRPAQGGGAASPFASGSTSPALGPSPVPFGLGGVGSASSPSSSSGPSMVRSFDHVVVAVEPDVVRRIVVTDRQTAEGRCIHEYLKSTASFTADIVAHRDGVFMRGTTEAPGGGNASASPSPASSSSSSAAAASSPPSPMRAVLPFFEDTATGLTVFCTGADAALALSVGAPAPRNASSTTANVSRLFKAGSDGSANLYETWNPVGSPKHVIKRARMTRAVWTVPGLQVAERFAKHAQGHGGIWYCGSYCARGVTLLEQACSSALDVAVDFGVKLPFEAQSSDEPLNGVWWIVAASLVLNVVAFAIRFSWRVWLAARGLLRKREPEVIIKAKQS